MFRYLAAFLIFLSSTSLIAQDENTPEFSDEDFIEYLQDSIVGAISEDWEVAYVEGSVEKTETGEFDVEASFYYSPRSPYDDVRLFLSNATALQNAIALINHNAESRGDEWSSFKFEFFPDETQKLTTW